MDSVCVCCCVCMSDRPGGLAELATHVRVCFAPVPFLSVSSLLPGRPWCDTACVCVCVQRALLVRTRVCVCVSA